MDVFPGNVIYDAGSANTTGNLIGISDINGDGIADTVSSSDGSGWALLDDNGIAHVFFGNMEYLDDTPGDDQWSYFPGTNGLMYWNENFGANPPLQISAALDLDGDSLLNIIGIASYFQSLSTYPSAGIDANGCIYLSYSAVVENLDQGTQNYRHIYLMRSCDGGCSWTNPVDVTPGTGFEECVYGSMANLVDSGVHIVYQRDFEPGLAVNGDLDAFVSNDIVYLNVPVSIIDTVSIGFVCPYQITASVSAAVTSCSYSCDGTASASVALGTPPFSFSWDDPAAQTTSVAVGLCPGSYTVTVLDSVGDTATAGVNITAPTAISLNTTSSGTCGQPTGSATVNASGGTGAYTYLWSPQAGGQSGSTATGLVAGSYSVSVTDGNGCVDSAQAVVAITSAVAAGITSNNPTSCSGSDGTATASATGGTTPYTYLWDSGTGGQTGSTATGLSSGTYSVIVSDSSGCADSASTSLSDPGAPSLQIDDSSMVSCFSGNDGSATVEVLGGTLPYSYQWSSFPVQTDSTATGLTAGSYSVTVTDGGNCSSASSVVITEPSALSLSFIVASVSCSGWLMGASI